MIFKLQENQIDKLEKFLQKASLADKEQLEYLNELAPGLVHYGEVSTEVGVDFYNTNNKTLTDYLSEILDIQNVKPLTIHTVNYSINGEVLEHIDANSFHTYVIMLEDNFEGGDFYLNKELIDFKKRGDVAYYEGWSSPHSISKITKGNRKVLVLWYSEFPKNIL
jgi:hypothetical protein|tara:strand:- start:193 stop:687 length:495 start_codon:yes stop_codon:yes gene_type:complete